VGDLAPRRSAVVTELQLEAAVLQILLEPADGRFGGIQFQPSRVWRLPLGNAAPQQETPGHRRAQIDQHLQVARRSAVVVLEEESQGCMIDRDVRVTGNRDGEIQGLTVIPSAPADERSVPQMFCKTQD